MSFFCKAEEEYVYLHDLSTITKTCVMMIDLRGKEINQFFRLCRRLESTNPGGLTTDKLYERFLKARAHGKRI